MAKIKVMSAGAVKSMVAALAGEFERETGNTVDLNFGTAGSLRERIKNGEAADLVILSESAIAELATLGIVVSSTVTDLGRTVAGVVIREGTKAPDISTPQAFKQALLNARSVAYTDPKAGGSGGIMFSALLQNLDAGGGSGWLAGNNYALIADSNTRMTRQEMRFGDLRPHAGCE